MENKKGFIYAFTLLAGSSLGGIFLPTLLSQNIAIGICIGAMTATLIILAIAPNIEHKFRKNLHGQQTKQPSKSEFKDLQAYLHPTRRHAVIGLLWSSFLIFFFVPAFGEKGESLLTINSISVLLLLFMSLDGYQMIKRNIRIDRYGRVVRGAGSQYIGYITLSFCWGGCIIIILIMIFGW